MESIAQAARLMADRFWEDPGIQAQMRGVSQARNLFELQCSGQLAAYQELGLLSLYRGGPSFSVAYRTDEFDAGAFALLVQKHSQEFIDSCTQSDLEALQASIAPVAAISDPVWYEKYFDGAVLDLQVIVVDRKLKGSGAFRAMIDPLLEASVQEGIPAVLQTHNPDNVSVYEHFDFKILEAPHAEDIDLTCYCMARTPECR